MKINQASIFNYIHRGGRKASTADPLSFDPSTFTQEFARKPKRFLCKRNTRRSRVQTHSRTFIFLLAQMAMRHRGGRETGGKDPFVMKKEKRKRKEKKRERERKKKGRGTTLEKHATCFHILFNYSTTFKVAPPTGRVAASPLRGFV